MIPFHHKMQYIKRVNFHSQFTRKPPFPLILARGLSVFTYVNQRYPYFSCRAVSYSCSFHTPCNISKASLNLIVILIFQGPIKMFIVAMFLPLKIRIPHNCENVLSTEKDPIDYWGEHISITVS